MQCSAINIIIDGAIIGTVATRINNVTENSAVIIAVRRLMRLFLSGYYIFIRDNIIVIYLAQKKKRRRLTGYS